MVVFCSVTDMCTACDDDDNVIKCLWTDLLDDMFTKTWTRPCEATALAEDLHEMEPNSPDCKRGRAAPHAAGRPLLRAVRHLRRQRGCSPGTRSATRHLSFTLRGAGTEVQRWYVQHERLKAKFSPLLIFFLLITSEKSPQTFHDNFGQLPFLGTGLCACVSSNFFFSFLENFSVLVSYTSSFPHIFVRSGFFFKTQRHKKCCTTIYLCVRNNSGSLPYLITGAELSPCLPQEMGNEDVLLFSFTLQKPEKKH